MWRVFECGAREEEGGGRGSRHSVARHSESNIFSISFGDLDLFCVCILVVVPVEEDVGGDIWRMGVNDTIYL